MARLRKSFEEQINTIDEQINKLQNKIDTLLQQRTNLQNKQRDEEIGALYELMKENNLSIEELSDMLQSVQQPEQQSA